METIVLKVKDEKERIFFLELAKRLGVQTQSAEEFEDEQLLETMKKNKSTGRTGREKVFETLNNILNEEESSYKK
jgi:hypothetical protein